MDYEIKIHDDEGKPVRTKFAVTAARVQHYDDVVEYMTKDAIAKYVAKHNAQPSKEQIAFLQKELVRYAIIRKDLTTAQKLTISHSQILNEVTTA